MGSTGSKAQCDAQSKAEEEEQTSGARDILTLKMDYKPKKLDESRLVELMQAIQRLIRLQREATSARVSARQKMREATFKRQDVWIWDAKFMGEIQRLTAQGKLADFDELRRIGEQCQNVRNGLGPIEQEGIDAEQQWEGSIWKLRQAEENLKMEFGYELEAVESYPPAPTSVGSSEYKTSSSPRTQPSIPEVEKGQSAIRYRAGASVASSASYSEQLTVPGPHTQFHEHPRQDSMLLGMESREVEDLGEYSDSGIGDIDDVLQEKSAEDLTGLSRHSLGDQGPHIELYPNLLTEFASRRERINNWLENTILVSRMDATFAYTILKGLLEAENLEMPSNWSQLVIAYWELDGAAIPGSRHAQLQPRPPSGYDETGHFKANEDGHQT
jgi:hypothetical protein